MNFIHFIVSGLFTLVFFAKTSLPPQSSWQRVRLLIERSRVQSPVGSYPKKNLTVGDFNFCFFGILRGSTLRFERSFSWSTTLYLNSIGRGVYYFKNCTQRQVVNELTRCTQFHCTVYWKKCTKSGTFTSVTLKHFIT